MGKRAIVVLLAACTCHCSDPAIKDVLTFGIGSGARGFGEVCIPPDESSPEFGSYSQGEVNVSIIDPQCATGACLVRDFQGRVTCPDGNLDGGECFTPEGELVTGRVRPHAPYTEVEDHVYCSCRCGGPSELAPFCECPSGTTCEPLIPDYHGRSVNPALTGAGSYCVKR